MSPGNLFALACADLRVSDIAAPHRCVVGGAITVSCDALVHLGAIRIAHYALNWIRTPVPTTASQPNHARQSRALST